MTVGEREQELAERQRELAPKEDLSPYAGQWVALRNGYVVASALDAVTLRKEANVREDDVLLPVPRHGADINVL